MRDFKVTTLAYMTHQPMESFRARPEAELTSGLLQQLGQAPWLVVLDGLERVLAAYHRSDAAQLRDEDVREQGDTGLSGRRTASVRTTTTCCCTSPPRRRRSCWYPRA